MCIRDSGDVALTKEIFGLFKNQVEMWSRQLVADANDENWAAITHSLKGTAIAVGAVKLAEVCENAESLIGERNKPAARQTAVQNLEYRISRTQTEISRWEYNQKMKEMRS